jgi:hypothetical protein
MASGYDSIRDMLRAADAVDTVEQIKEGMFIVHMFGGERWLVQTDRLDA